MYVGRLETLKTSSEILNSFFWAKNYLLLSYKQITHSFINRLLWNFKKQKTCNPKKKCISLR